eukprot:12193062-Ditylum_brightwellii.AAC.1
MTFNIFSHYLTTQGNRKGKFLLKTVCGGIRSSMCHLYRMAGVDMKDDFKKDIAQFLGGMKRT